MDGGGRDHRYSAEFETGGAQIIGVTESAALYGKLARWPSTVDSLLEKSELRVRVHNLDYTENVMSQITPACVVLATGRFESSEV